MLIKADFLQLTFNNHDDIPINDRPSEELDTEQSPPVIGKEMIVTGTPCTQSWNWHLVTHGEAASLLEEKWRKNSLQTGNRRLTCWIGFYQVRLCYMMWHALKWPEAMSFCVTLVASRCSSLNNHGKAYPQWSQIICMPPLRRRGKSASLWTVPPMSHVKMSKSPEVTKATRVSIVFIRGIKILRYAREACITWQGSPMAQGQPVFYNKEDPLCMFLGFLK